MYEQVSQKIYQNRPLLKAALIPEYKLSTKAQKVKPSSRCSLLDLKENLIALHTARRLLLQVASTL